MLTFKAISFVLATILVGAFAQSIGYPTPVCFQPGTAGAYQCAQFIDTFCSDVGGPTSPAVRIGDNTKRCFTLPNGNRCDFVAFNTYNANVHPSAANCRTVLNRVLNTCTANGGGGSAISQTAYTFSVDVNAGACAWTIQPGT